MYAGELRTIVCFANCWVTRGVVLMWFIFITLGLLCLRDIPVLGLICSTTLFTVATHDLERDQVKLNARVIGETGRISHYCIYVIYVAYIPPPPRIAQKHHGLYLGVRLEITPYRLNVGVSSFDGVPTFRKYGGGWNVGIWLDSVII